MLARLKLVSNFLVECFMFGCAGLLGVIFLPFVIVVAWMELFREMRDEFKKLGRPVSHVDGVEELGGEEVDKPEEV